MIGGVLGTVGFALWAWKMTDLSLGTQWWAIVLAGAGIGFMLGPACTDAVNRAIGASYGEVTGITQTIRNYGSALGLAVLGTLLSRVLTSRLTDSLVAAGVPAGQAGGIAAQAAAQGGAAGGRRDPGGHARRHRDRFRGGDPGGVLRHGGGAGDLAADRLPASRRSGDPGEAGRNGGSVDRRHTAGRRDTGSGLIVAGGPVGQLRRRRMLTAAVILVAIVLIPVVLLWIFQRRLVFLPDTSAPGPVGRYLAGARDVRLVTADGLQLTAWYRPAPSGPQPVTVLIAPGNAGNRLGRLGLLRGLSDRGLGVLLLEYRGYGGNPGSPTEAGLALDARAARGFLETEGPAGGALLYFGESLGGAVVTGLSTAAPPAALVLRSPFVDLAAAAAVHYPVLPVRAMLRDRFPVRDTVNRLDIPVTVIYGDSDRTIPPGQSRAVAAAAGDTRTVVVPGADHNDPALVDGPAVVAAVAAAAEALR